MAYSYTDPYRAFRNRQAQLVAMFQKAQAFLDGLDMPRQSAVLQELEKKVRSDSFKIQVTGTFKNGKSTFINAFLGEDVLPAYALPCTAVINEVRYGKEKKAVLYFRDPLPDRLPAQIPGAVMAHMRKHGMEKVPPVVIPYDRIEDFVVIPMGTDPTQMLLESPYEKVTLYWPRTLLQQGVQIVDSPGLNEHATRTRVTMEHLSKADAILFVLSAQSLCSKEEMSFLEHSLAAQGFHDLIFVVNRFDCIPERERPAIQRYAHEKLERYTSFGAQGIFFTSALEALEAKKSRDDDRLKASGMVKLEMGLSKFLVEQKGKAKLAQPARQLGQILQQETLGRMIPRHRQMLDSEIEDVKKRYQAAMPRIELLEEQKERLQLRMATQIEEHHSDFVRAARENIEALSELASKWIEEYTPTTKLGMIPSKLKVQSLVKEITSHLSEMIEKDQNDWRNRVLGKMIDETSEKIFQPARGDVEAMLGRLDSISDEVSGIRQESNDLSQPGQDALPVSKFAIGSLDESVLSGVSGSSKSFATTAAIEVGAGLLLGMFGLLSPAVLVAMVCSTLAVGSQSNAKAADKVKKQILEQLQKQLQEEAPKFSKNVADEVSKRFVDSADQLVSMVDVHIDGAQTQMRALIAEMEQGKEHIRQRQAALAAAEQNVMKLKQDLDRWCAQVLK